MKLKNNLISLARVLMPKMYWKRKINYLRQHKSEIEMELLPYLCNKDKISIDIGAASGSYLANMVNLSSKVIGFEPIPAEAYYLNEMIKGVNANAAIECVALSDKNGEATLRMMDNDFGRSTIEESNTLLDTTGSSKTSLTVPVRRLDDYNLHNVGFIKIDVEGHEYSVLNGAIDTINNNFPVFLIEIEDRHKQNSLTDVPLFLKNFGYNAYFILDGKIKPFADFNKQVHQDSNNIGDFTDGFSRKGIYINNFIFIPQNGIFPFINYAIPA